MGAIWRLGGFLSKASVKFIEIARICSRGLIDLALIQIDPLGNIPIKHLDAL